MRKTFVAAVLACVALAATIQARQAPQNPAPPARQAPPLTFKLDVNYVEIDASVRDAQGHFVGDLTRDDFEILEDGKPQTLNAFAQVNIPVEHVDPPLYTNTPIPPDTASNERPFEGRVFVVVIDDLNTSFTRTPRLRAAARQFIEHYVGDNDMIAVVNTSGYSKASQDFTSSRALAVKALAASMGNKAESATSAGLEDARNGTTSSAATNDFERYTKARNTLRTLQNISDYLAGMRGRRKAVVYFSEGVSYDMNNPMTNKFASDVLAEFQRTLAAATRANVSFYSVDPRGVSNGLEDAISIPGFGVDNSSTTNLMEEQRVEQSNLRTIAEGTGGFALINQNDFRTGFSRIIEDSSSYYVLGYYPTNDKHDGKYRSVRVKVRRPGLTVRARDGYNAPSGKAKDKDADAELPPGAVKTSPALRDALESPLQVSGLTINAFAAPLRGANGKDAIPLSIEIDGPGLTFTHSADGVYHDDIELVLFASPAGGGKIKDGSHDVVTLALHEQTHAAVAQNAVRIVQRMELPPGKYKLRIGAREAGGGKVGTIVYDLDAPDFSKPPLIVSGIAITSAYYSTRVPSTSGDKGGSEFKDVLPAAPTARRDFPRGDTLAIFAEVYDNIRSAAHRVAITASVLSDTGTTVYTHADERSSTELAGAGGGYGYTAQIPLAAVAPGRYVLHLEAKSLSGNDAPVTRDVEFRVR